MIKYLFCALFAILLNFHSSVIADSEIYPQESESVQNISQILDYLHGPEGKKVWPSFDISNAPVILWFDTGHVYSINLKSKNPAWHDVPGFGKSVQFSESDEWDVTQVEIHPEFAIEDQKAYVFHMDLMKDDPSLSFLVFIHERFHPYQYEKFLAHPENDSDGYQDHINLENLALIKVEDRLLLKFLQANNSDKLECLKDFNAVHQQRLKLLSQSSRYWESDQQRMEGLAEYVSLKTLDAPALLPLFSSQRYLQHHLYNYINDPEVSDLAIKRRHYGVGGTLAYALDFLDIQDWKQKVEVQGASLDQLLNQKLSMDTTEISNRFEALKKAFSFSTIKESIADSVEAYSKKISGLLEEYKNQEGIEIVIHKPTNESISGGGVDNGLFFLANGSTLSLENSSVASTNDSNWKMELSEAPFVLKGKGGESRFKIEKDLVITIDGQEHAIADLMKCTERKPFEEISWSSTLCQFYSEKHQGSLYVENGELIINYR